MSLLLRYSIRRSSCLFVQSFSTSTSAKDVHPSASPKKSAKRIDWDDLTEDQIARLKEKYNKLPEEKKAELKKRRQEEKADIAANFVRGTPTFRTRVRGLENPIGRKKVELIEAFETVQIPKEIREGSPLLKSYFLHQLGITGRIRDAIIAFQKFRHQRATKDLYETIIQVLAASGKKDFAFKFFSEMAEVGRHPKVYYTLIFHLRPLMDKGDIQFLKRCYIQDLTLWSLQNVYPEEELRQIKKMMLLPEDQIEHSGNYIKRLTPDERQELMKSRPNFEKIDREILAAGFNEPLGQLFAATAGFDPSKNFKEQYENLNVGNYMNLLGKLIKRSPEFAMKQYYVLLKECGINLPKHKSQQEETDQGDQRVKRVQEKASF